MKKKVCVVIPIYKEELNNNEINSLLQCFKILNNHDIFLICSINLNIFLYLKALEKLNINIKIKHFNDQYFKNIKGYNSLLLSQQFYKKFNIYEYMLVYQLDAWVFKDDLVEWCDKGYDYIGAPWYAGYENATESSKFIGVGNGGFSLRKISSHLKALNTFSYLQSPLLLSKEYLKNKKLSFGNFIKVLSFFTYSNNTFSYFNDYTENEDYYWGSFIPKRLKWFKLPSELEASKFSMETKAPELYKINKHLPFGCHGWYKYHVDFWKTHIYASNE